MRSSSFERYGVRAGSWIGGLLLMGCGGPEVADIVGNEVSLTVTGVASAPEVAALGAPREKLGVSRAFVSTSDLSLIPCAINTRQVSMGARGYDLLQEPAPNERVTTAVFDLCGLRVDIDPVSESAAEGIPDGSSLYVEGDDAEGEPFVLASEHSASLLLEPEDGASFGDQPLLLGFDVSVWLAGLPLPAEQAEMSAELFEAQLRGSAALYVDSNGNGALDDGEQTPVARAAPSR